MANTNVRPDLTNFPFEGGAGGLRARLIDHDGPASYTTGGETITAASLGFRRISYVGTTATAGQEDLVEPSIPNKKDAASFKLIWSVRTTGAEEAAAANLSARSCKLLVVGIP